jgi:predicted esterase
MRTTVRGGLAALAFAPAVLLLLPLAEHALAGLGRLRAPMDCECVLQERARLNIVYLHGLDSYGPSWHEIRSREKLKSIAQVLKANLAFPRAPGVWPKGTAEDIQRSRGIINAAAGKCFETRAQFGIIGFSDGGNLANQLFLLCRPSDALWTVSVGSEGALARKDKRTLSGCGAITLIAGRHEPTLAVTRSFARQLAARGAEVRFIEHSGPHDIPFEETLSAIGDMVGRK